VSSRFAPCFIWRKPSRVLTRSRVNSYSYSRLSLPSFLSLHRGGFRINAREYPASDDRIQARVRVFEFVGLLDVFWKQKGRTVPTHASHAQRPVINFRRGPLEFAIADSPEGARSGTRRIAFPSASNQIPTIVSPRSGLVYLLGEKTGSVLQSNETRGPAFVPPPSPPPPPSPYTAL